MGVDIFIEFLNHLHTTIEDMGKKFEWAIL